MRTQSVWWNDQVKAVVKRKEVLGVRDEEARERLKGVFIKVRRGYKNSLEGR